MKNIKLIGLSIFLVGVLSYNISTLSNTSNVTLGDLSTMAMAYTESTGDYNYKKAVRLKDVIGQDYWDCETTKYKKNCTQELLDWLNVHYDPPY